MNPFEALRLAWGAWQLVREIADYIDAGFHDTAQQVAQDRTLQMAAGMAARRSQAREARNVKP